MKKRKDAAAVKLGRRGGKARVRNMTLEQLSEAGRKAVKARWAKAKKGLSDQEIAAGLRISEERLDAAFVEAGMQPHPKKAAAASAKVKSKRAKATKKTKKG